MFSCLYLIAMLTIALSYFAELMTVYILARLIAGFTGNMLKTMPLYFQLNFERSTFEFALIMDGISAIVMVVTSRGDVGLAICSQQCLVCMTPKSLWRW